VRRTDKRTGRLWEEQTKGQTGWKKNRQKGRQDERRTDKRTGRMKAKQTKEQTDCEKNRQTDKSTREKVRPIRTGQRNLMSNFVPDKYLPLRIR
jgi:hypothetical protein